MKKIFRFYTTENGKIPAEEWLMRLRKKDYASYLRIRNRMSAIGEFGHYGDCKNVGDGVMELRFFFGPGFRLYFGEDGDTIIVLLCGGDKSTQQKDIQSAKNFWRLYNA